MSIFAEAARYLDAYAEEHQDMPEAIKHVMEGADFEEILHVADQRALRAIMVMRGENPNRPNISMVKMDSQERALQRVLTAVYMDGLAIGWKARELKEQQ